MELSQEYLKSILHYNKETGIFTWIKCKSQQKYREGTTAGCLNAIGYVTIKVNGKYQLAHRLAWIYMYDEVPNKIDHKNHIRNDNRLENLRNVSATQNQRNKSMQHNNTSGQTGVHYVKKHKRWRANIYLNNKCKYLGQYKKIEDAIKARKEAEVEYNFHKNHGR